MTINRIPSFNTGPSLMEGMRDVLPQTPGQSHTPPHSATSSSSASRASSIELANLQHPPRSASRRLTTSHAPRTPEVQTKLDECRATLSPTDQLRFDGVCDKLDDAYDLWRSKTVEADLPLFDEAVATRIMDLTDKGYSHEKLERLESKAARLDKWADRVVGGAKSTPFAIASVLTDLLPALSGGKAVTDPYIKGYIVGAISAIFDTAGGEALSRAVHDAWWLRINPTDQTPDLQYDPETNSVSLTRHPGEMPSVMQKAVENLDADIGLTKKMGQAALSFQSYTVRNVARTVISPVVSLFAGDKAVAAVDTAAASLGGIAAGAGAYQGLGYFAEKNGTSGLQALLSRRDYLHRLEQLEKVSLTQQAGNAVVRGLKVPIDIVTDGTDALQSVFRPENLTAELGPLAGGIAAIALAKTKAAAYASIHNFTRAQSHAFTQMAGTLTMVPVLGLWPATSMVTNHFKKPAAQIIHQRFHQKPAGTSGSGVAGFGAEVISANPALSALPRTNLGEGVLRNRLNEGSVRSRSAEDV